MSNFGKVATLEVPRRFSMASVVAWNERRFNFDFPTDLHPQILERLRGTPARMEDRIREIPAQRLAARDGKRWSIKENLGHLTDAERLFMERLDDFDAGAPVLRAADPTNRRTDDAGYNDRAIESICAQFRKARMETIRRLEAVDVGRFAQTALHPRLGAPMRIVDLMHFHAEHDDHHLARVSELAREPAFVSITKEAPAGRSALVCDDKAYMRRVIGRVLQQIDVTVVGEAVNGVDAVAKYRDLTPDLVTMDIIMPDMSGLDAVREILRLDPAARILICSGMGQEALVSEAIRAGARGYVLKPFTLSDLLEGVSAAL